MAKNEFKFFVLGDASSAQRALQQLNDATDTTADRMSRLGDRFTAIGKKATLFVSLPIAAAFGAATKAASDLSETTSKAANVFGKSADEVEKWADTAAKSFGQSKRQALDAAATFGNLFVQLGIGADVAAKMSKAQTELASDFASFHNTSPEQAIEAMTAAYRGEFDAVQKYVPTINAANVEQKALAMGLATTTKELDAQDKALAVNALLTEGAGKAAGDFDRTAGGLANKTRTLKAQFEDISAQMGERLIPIALKVAGVITKVLEAFGGLPEGGQQFVVIAGLALAAVGPIASLTGNILKLTGYLNGGTVGAQRLGGALKGLALAGGILAAVSLLKVGLDALGLSAKGVEVDMKRLAAASGDELVAAFRKAEKIGQGQEVFNKILAESVTEAQRLVDGLKDAGVETGKFQRAIDEAVRVERAGIAAKQKDTEVTLGLKTATEDLTTEVKEEKTAFEKVKDAVDEFNTALQESLGVTLSSNDAQRQHRERVEALAVAIKENGVEVGFATEKQRALGEALDGAVESAQREVEALTRDGKIAADNASQKGALIARLEELKQKYPQLAGAIDAHIAKIQSVPNEKATKLSVETAEAARRVEQLKAIIAGIRDARVNITPDTGNILRRAHGGPAKGLTLVGEEGPELVNFGTQSYVTDARKTARALAGTDSATPVVNNYYNTYNEYVDVHAAGHVMTEFDLIELVDSGLKARRRRNGTGDY